MNVLDRGLRWAGESSVREIVRIAAIARMLAMVLGVTEEVFELLGKDQTIWGAMDYIYVFSCSAAVEISHAWLIMSRVDCSLAMLYKGQPKTHSSQEERRLSIGMQ